MRRDGRSVQHFDDRPEPIGLNVRKARRWNAEPRNSLTRLAGLRTRARVLQEGNSFMLAHQSTAVTTAFPHPRWCTEQHHNVGPGTHQSAEMPLGMIGDIPVTVQRVQDDPEPGRPETRHDLWLAIGGQLVELPVDDAASLPQQIRNVAASLELILGGAR